MKTILLRADDVLRHGSWVSGQGRITQHVIQLSLMLCLFGFLYGSVMGSFAGITPDHFLQIFYSAIKVPLLLFGIFCLSLPSFFVLNNLAGLRDDFFQVLRALMASQAGLTIILASLAPFTAFWYLSFANYHAAILFNTAMFGLASILAQFVLKRYYQPLIDKNMKHQWMMRSWLVIYSFVGIQMGWVLRPFIGNPNTPTQFFREHAWGNAYEKLLDIIIALISG